MIQKLIRWFSRISRRDVIRQTPRMTEEELQGAFAISDETPLFKAVCQKLDDYIEDSIYIASLPETAKQPGILAHTVGGVEQLRQFRQDLLETRKTAWEVPKKDNDKQQN